MEIKTFLSILKKRILTIIFVSLSILILVISGSYFFVKPTYQSMENIVVGQLNKENSEYRETRELSMLLASTIDFIKSPSVLNAASEEFNSTYEELSDQVVVQNTMDSQIVSVVVRDDSPEEAKKIAKFIAVTTEKKMADLFDVKDISVLSDSVGNPSAQRVDHMLVNIGLGLVVGILVGIGTAVMREHFDDSVKSSEQIEKKLGIKVYGTVHLKKKVPKKKLVLEPPIETTDYVRTENKKRGEMRV
ncbi:Wzz/FepE/Etk N-terminal domain-containing protein [Halobacillus sp. ACCC02827]|uniref:YveK family protein n=1 Tax=Halobacillus sp. ACCC02827 TaxID=3052090 RepID=UPI002570596D|nr:Wzz/FepE/Etk N-terminal domain-containing protein [Halobacillus sp. ACCC02827]WJE15008.1 Wzz/FepE/Etk N-terminal domain-containing protein [Halobacillus sp. ACCC02827]